MESEGKEEYENLSLHKLRGKKIGEAVELLTDQSGLNEFAPDGGQELQIPNPQPDKIWFWYDPTSDSVLQVEIQPYQVVGIFTNEEDVDRFINAYAERYSLEDIGHLEKYSAELEYHGTGPTEFQQSTETEEEYQNPLDEFL